MKKILFSIFSLLVLLAGCTQELNEQAARPSRYTLTASLEPSGTRTVLGPNGAVYWSAGDEFCVANPRIRMTLTGEGGSGKGVFSCEETTSFVPDDMAMAVYPYDAFQAYEDGTVLLSVPEVQDYQQNTFDKKAHLMVGCLSGQAPETVQFRNMMGMVSFTLTGVGTTLSSLTVTDVAGDMLWGSAHLPASDWMGGISSSMLTGGTSSLTLRCEGLVLGEEPVTFYLLVPQGVFRKGFQLTAYAQDGTAFRVETAQANVIARNVLRQMPAVALNRSLSVLNLHNAAVAKYLSYEDRPAFTVRSHFTTHPDLKDSGFINKDLPQAFPLSWTGDASSYLVTLTDMTRGGDVYTRRQVTGTSYELVNLVPGHAYEYKVEDGEQVVLQGGVLAQGLVREVVISDSWNYRDIGGWTGWHGRPVAYEWIYRGGSLNGTWTGKVVNSSQSATTISNPSSYVFSALGQQQLQDLGIRGELDLRSIASEKSYQRDNTHAYSLDQNHTGLTDWVFKRIATSSALSSPTQYTEIVKDVAWIIHQVVDERMPIAVHCKSGADRTGAVVLTLLAILGVDPGDIARDYELTLYSHEQSVVIGVNQFRDRNAQSGEVASFFSGVTKAISQPTLLETFYYYLNRYFEGKGVAISCSDLDRFIEMMLGLPAGGFQHPSWAVEQSKSLQEIYGN